MAWRRGWIGGCTPERTTHHLAKYVRIKRPSASGVRSAEAYDDLVADEQDGKVAPQSDQRVDVLPERVYDERDRDRD